VGVLRHVMRRARSATRASTLLEVAVGAALVAFALVAAIDSVESVGQMNEFHAEERRALEVAESKLAYLRSLSFSNVLPTIAACTTLSQFSVPDLPPRRRPGSQGTITVWTDETAVPRELGGPMDLNGNGTATDTTVGADAQILPVRVTVTWGTRGAGPSEVSITLWAILNAGDAP
jgi:hypothetical protein